MSRETILLLEDDSLLLRANVGFLEMDGYRVLACAKVEEARETLRTENPDIMVLDVLLPDGSGIAFCREYREAYGNGTPVLFLTAMNETADIDAGYFAGGVDYLIKPFRIDRLAVKIRALLDNIKAAREMIVLGKLRLDCTSNVAYLDEEDLFLAPKEYLVLEYLVRNRNKAVTAEAIYVKVWRYPMNDDDSAVKSMVSRLRKKLRGSGYTIGVRRGEGYCFSGPPLL